MNAPSNPTPWCSIPADYLVGTKRYVGPGVGAFHSSPSLAPHVAASRRPRPQHTSPAPSPPAVPSSRHPAHCVHKRQERRPRGPPPPHRPLPQPGPGASGAPPTAAAARSVPARCCRAPPLGAAPRCPNSRASPPLSLPSAVRPCRLSPGARAAHDLGQPDRSRGQRRQAGGAHPAVRAASARRHE